MKKMPISLFCGGIAILVTILLYVLILGNAFLEAICLITLFGLILAEAVTTLFAYLSKGNPRKVAAAVVSGAMIPVAAIMSVTYIISGFDIGKYVLWYLVLALIIYALAIVLTVFDSKKQSEAAELQDAKASMLSLRKLVKCIMLEPAAEPYKKALSDLEEQLHFSNDAVVVPQDATISDMLIDLQTNISVPGYDVEGAIAAISRTIKARNIMASNNA